MVYFVFSLDMATCVAIMATPIEQRPLMSKRRKLDPLSEKQREIMEIVWENGEASVFEVRDELLKHRKVARNTVRTMMERLEEKGWLTHRVIGRPYFYSATVEESVSLGERFIDFIDGTFGGSPENLMSALLEHRGLDNAEIERIRKMLNDAKKQKKGKK